MYPRGKVLGGSSVLHDMMYMRGDPGCFDEWAAAGNAGWSSKDVLKYFMKAENNSVPYLVHSPFHGRSGPLPVNENHFQTPLGNAFIDAGKELHYEVKDLNGKGGVGFMKSQFNARDGERWSTSKAYLQPSRHRTNLHISMKSRVTKVLINDHSKTAYGVRFIKDNEEHVVFAENEIILSAGSFNSPQILMLSGVGPEEDLKKLNIPVIADSPVGQNMKDHVGVYGVPLTISKPGSYDSLHFGENDVLDYAKNRRGKLSACSSQATALIKSKYATNNIPDIQVIFAPSNVFFNKAATTGLGLNSEFYDTVYGKLNKTKSLSMIAWNSRATSIGYLKLATANPLDAPLINPKYFSDPRDLDVSVEAIKAALAIANTGALKKYGIKYPGFNYPGCKDIKKNTDEYWRCVVRHHTGAFLHATSTCQMGIDDKAVVDPRLSVYGVSGLRVIDASVMPRPTNANINGAIMMIGEKGADLVKEDWGEYYE